MKPGSQYEIRFAADADVFRHDVLVPQVEAVTIGFSELARDLLHLLASIGNPDSQMPRKNGIAETIDLIPRKFSRLCKLNLHQKCLILLRTTSSDKVRMRENAMPSRAKNHIFRRA